MTISQIEVQKRSSKKKLRLELLKELSYLHLHGKKVYICPRCKERVHFKSKKCVFCGEKYSVPVRVPLRLLKGVRGGVATQRLHNYVHTYIIPYLNDEYRRRYLDAYFTLAIDGTPQASNSGSNYVSSISETISTSNGTDVIVVLVETANAITTMTMSDSSSAITWLNGTTTPYKKINNPNSGVALYAWIGTTSSTLSNDSVTASFGSQTSFAGMVVFAISGANTSSPVDTTATTTGYSSTNVTSQTSSSFSTSNANDMLLYLLGGAEPGSPTGESWTAGNIGGTASTLCGDTTSSGYQHAAAEYLLVSSTQNSITAAISWNNSLYVSYAVFAIQAASGATPVSAAGSIGIQLAGTSTPTNLSSVAAAGSVGLQYSGAATPTNLSSISASGTISIQYSATASPTALSSVAAAGSIGIQYSGAASPTSLSAVNASGTISISFAGSSLIAVMAGGTIGVRFDGSQTNVQSALTYVSASGSIGIQFSGSASPTALSPVAAVGSIGIKYSGTASPTATSPVSASGTVSIQFSATACVSTPFIFTITAFDRITITESKFDRITITMTEEN
jgi:hypothetical protein